MACILYVTLAFTIVSLVSMQNIEVEFRIDEGKAAGELIGNIASKSGLAANLSSEAFQSLRYTFLEDTEVKAILNLNSETGALFTSVLIDREAIHSCGDKPECVLAFQVAANSEPTANFFVIRTKVWVRDINDNSPTFPSPIFQVNISESEAVGYQIPLPAATDLDPGPNNGIVSYDIFPVNGTFGLNYTKKLDNSFLVQLILKKPLDREETEQYVVFVFAKDGGDSSSNSGKLQVDISVIDVNDNPPVFNQVVYNKNISEDTLPGTTILQVLATDLDKGDNSKISYQFSQHSSDTIKALFAIRNNTGEIYLLQKLVYDENEIYTIIVEATDKGARPKVAQAKVNIRVEDAGNNQPIVKVNLLSGTGGGVSLSESAQIGAFVAHVNVEDSDKGDNGRVQCEAHPEIFSIENLTGNGYKVVIKTALDRENSDTHNVTITCRDFGSPRLSSSESFLVHVVDDNDNDPKFLRDLYVRTVPENDDIGRVVVQVSAADKDDGVNAQIQYYLYSGAGSNFAINSNTGVITATTQFDRETTSQYKFQILAVDQGDPQRTGTANVTVNISDENDNNPKFDRSEIVFDIKENMNVDTVVGQVVATDADVGKNAKLHYFMDSQDKFSVPFVVFPDGLIKSNQELDREFQSQYGFKVYAQDSGNPSRNTSVYITVVVTDENDNEPIITFPSKMNDTVTSPVTSLPVTTIRAHDVDEGINKKLVYYIHSGNENGMFILREDSGELFLNRGYAITTDQSVSLIICVKDSGNPVKTKCAQLKTLITINNATTASLVHENDNKYITISIVVVIVTILISAAIVVTIIFIRRIDRNRQKLKNNQGPLGVPMQNGLPANSTSGNDPDQEKEYLERKTKKEVTFSGSLGDEGHSIGSYSGNYTINLTNENKSLYDKPPAYSLATKPTAPPSDSQIEALNALKLQQILLKSSTEQQNQNAPGRAHPSDSNSDTSGETTTSDSGRGGSEDDVPGNSLTHDDSRSFDFTNANTTLSPISYMSPVYGLKVPPPSKPPRPPSRSISHSSSEKRHSTSYEKIKVPTSANPTHNNYSYLSYNDSYRSNRNSEIRNPPSQDWDFLNQDGGSRYSNIPKDRDYFHLGPGSISTLRSRDDDDDAATTTSGSYTINPEELDDELGFRMQKDLVV